MLSELRVENLGIVEELLVPVGAGMTVITGETGAGKTLVVDALELLCGGRADPSVVREGASEARVQGRFVLEDEEDEVVLARVVPAVGRSRGYVNGGLVTAAELSHWGRRLVDLHGQHAHQHLLHAADQRALLDRAAGNEAACALAQLRDARASARAAEEELAALGGDERTRAREVDLLRYQADEIDAAAIMDIDEDERLAADEALLADAEVHRDALYAAHTAAEGPAQDALGAAVAALAGRAPFAPLADRLRSLQAETAEIAYDLRVAQEGVVADPERLAAVQARRALLRELVRKYGPTLADVCAYAIETRTRLAALERHDARAAALEAQHSDAAAVAHAAAADLSRVRRAAAGPLAEAVTNRLRELALAKARFAIEIEPTAQTGEGADEVTFVLAPNPGEPPRPLARTASGGELSRAMLALRVVLSEAPPTLVFDEVDAGIGGEAGTAVGRALAELGGRHQVLCVTHLAQVAAFADAHLAVSKNETRGRMVARAALCLDDARVTELARMLAGDVDSATAREHARELLDRSARARTKVRR
ncbi:MAG: DNA repair protein RecN [Actinomycetota bacterium]